MTPQLDVKNKQIWLLILTCYVLIFFFIFIYPNNVNHNPAGFWSNVSLDDPIEPTSQIFPLYKEVVNEKELQAALNKSKEVEYTIVVWEPPFGARSNPRRTDEENCGRCLVTQDKSKVTDANTKAVVFHFNEANLANVPKVRRPDQLYVWYTMESSPALLLLRRMTLKEFDDFFNLTASHRRDSDVYWPYNVATQVWKSVRDRGSGNPEQDIDLLVSKKTDLALWIVSNCGGTRGAIERSEYVKHLMDAGLKVDCKGKCFPNNGPVDNVDIAKKYKFYLSFENGHHCRDYITEKLFHNAYMMDSVPVVWGATRADYEAVAPPGSFIYAEDFQSPAQLVIYLNYLNKNDEAYRKFFEWRTMNITEMPQYGRTRGDCNLCRILHGINVDNVFNPRYAKLQTYIPMFGYPNISRTVSSLGKWYYGTERQECLGKINLAMTLKVLG